MTSVETFQCQVCEERSKYPLTQGYCIRCATIHRCRCTNCEQIVPTREWDETRSICKMCAAAIDEPECLIIRATRLMMDLHRGQVRKGDGEVPYFTHPMSVCARVGKAGGTYVEMAAALLHDGIEDGGPGARERIHKEVSPQVAKLVFECSDSETALKGAKRPWKERKDEHLERMRHASLSALIIMECDKIDNLEDTIKNVVFEGLDHFKKFNSTLDQMFWYYQEAYKIFMCNGHSVLANELEKLIRKLHDICKALNSSLKNLDLSLEVADAKMETVEEGRQ